MELQINDNYKITTNSRNYIMNEKQTVQSGENKGEIKWVNIGYYPSLESLFNNYFDVRLMRSNANGLSEILEVCEKIKGEITTITDGFKKF